jgi:hypothetical protein
VLKNLDQAYLEALIKARYDTEKLVDLEERYEQVKERLRERFDMERDLKYKLKAEKLKKKQRVFRAVRWVARASTVAGVTTAIVLTGGLATPAAAALPAVEAWAQLWSNHDRQERERQEAEHRASRELQEEDIADIVSIVKDDASDKTLFDY